MDDRTWEVVDQLVVWFDGVAPRDESKTSRLAMRLVKLVGEVGEAADALIGISGANPRKGTYKTWDDLAAELGDVVITALLALASLTPDARRLFGEHVERVAGRIPNGGEPPGDVGQVTYSAMKVADPKTADPGAQRVIWRTATAHGPSPGSSAPPGNAHLAL